ncbi:YbcC family protein [Pseudorhodobacter sp. W20_MBD10_FR17]|uniref:YbcC family protein n=1 Tax=Pseudorhodobacter sp. W20_MBD10_FR17 TaxID=3240266 RepID=UPI003F9DF8EE
MTTLSTLSPAALTLASQTAARAIPPVWPLASSVAVNPFLGQTTETLAQVGARLGRVGGVPVTMPRAHYNALISDGTITDADITAAIKAAGAGDLPDLAEIKRRATTSAPTPTPHPMVADLVAAVSGIDWPAILMDRFGHWAAGYFDQGQALWAAPRRRSAYDAWRQYATHDLTPEIAGLKGFAQFVSETPDTAEDAQARAAARLGLSEDMLETYLHQLLFSLGGWAQVARYTLWQAELALGTDQTITDVLTIRLLWEEALFAQYEDQIGDTWASAKAAHASPVTPDQDIVINAILQEAWERAVQRDLAKTLAAPARAQTQERPALQAAFCIDVRSEVFRRALEAVNPGISTLGFAGFFGLTASHKGFASDVDELRLPVLLNPGVTSTSAGEDISAEQTARFKARTSRAWGRFKLAAVSSFAFVEATGPIYAGKLIKDALNIAPQAAANDPAPRLDPPLPLPAQINAAEKILRAMSLTTDFAHLVVLAGHGAHVVNNPFASGLQCGACGGYAGDVNARLLASLLNAKDVRHGLAERGIDIPADTLFLGALHDTTTDTITLFAADHPSAAHATNISQAKDWFAQAGLETRSERALRLPRAKDGADINLRSRDWAETRPEWALAGCKAFIAAPRQRTAGKSLAGRAFLHDYDWQRDNSFGVLELIMTAPVVVASWISLQYYGSTVAPDVFGSGNKLLHNVTGGIGVVEGNGGKLRAGLPWQSVHEGQGYAHDPLRLSVCIEAPRAAMTDILKRHESVRALFDNRWLHLFALDETGQMAWRYDGDLLWSEMDREVEHQVNMTALG